MRARTRLAIMVRARRFSRVNTVEGKGSWGMESIRHSNRVRAGSPSTGSMRAENSKRSTLPSRLVP
jgi:hypothetical protein